jgi:hypothetical protein
VDLVSSVYPTGWLSLAYWTLDHIRPLELVFVDLRDGVSLISRT